MYEPIAKDDTETVCVLLNFYNFDSIFIPKFLDFTIARMYSNYYYILASVMGFLGIITNSMLSGIGNSISLEDVEKNFSVISVDALIGTDYAYSRRDILELIPEILQDSFVIVIDDTNRKGEKNTVKEIEMILKENNISYGIHTYPGETDYCVIASKNNSFLCSL